MRILWVSHFLLYPETGYGALQRSRNLLKELCKYHDVHLICLYRDVDKKLVPNLEMAAQDLKKYCKSVYFVQHNITKIKKMFFVAKSLFLGIPYSAYLYRSKYLNTKILDLLLVNKFDFIHSDTIGMIEPMLHKIRTKKVLTHHDIESHKMYRRYKNETNFLKKIFFRMEYRNIFKYEQRYCSKYDMNVVVSEMDQNRLKDIDKSINIVVIENGVDCEYFQYHSRANDLYELIFAGALDYYPNVRGVLFFCSNVWPLLKIKYLDLKLTIIGKSPSKELRTYLESKKDIYMLGYVDDIRPHIKKARVFVCPIKEGGGTRIKILDAFSQGIPVVSTELGVEGLRTVDGDHVLIADSVPEYVDKISELLEDDGLANQIARNAREFVLKNHSFAYIGKKFADSFNKIFETDL